MAQGRATRRAFLRAAAAVSGWTALATACGGRAAGSGPVVLNLQAPYDGQLFGEMMPRFEAAHPGLRVDVGVSPAPGSASLAAALVAGSGPDVFWDNDPARYLGTPLLLDLSPFVASGAYDLGDFGSAVLGAFRYGGGLYMLPRSVSASAYAVRTDIWSAAGIAVPTAPYTADDLAGVWRRLSTAGRVIAGQLAWSPSSTFYLNGWGAHEVEPGTPTRCALGSAAAIACGQWMWDRFWVDNDAQGQQGQYPQANFAAGTLGMQAVSCAGLPAFAAAAAGVPWKLIPFPVWPSGSATAAETDFFAISAATAHPEAAWTLLTFVTSAAWQQAAIGTLLVPPARKSLWPQYVQEAPRILPALRGQDLTVFAQPVQDDWAFPPEEFRYQAPAAPILASYWQHIFGPGSTLTVKEGFTAAAAAVDRAEAAARGAAPGTAAARAALPPG